jgi:hypothetical protein
MTTLEQKIWELILKQKKQDIDIKITNPTPNEKKFLITPDIIIGKYPIIDKEYGNIIGYENCYISINDNIFYTDQLFFLKVADITTEPNEKYIEKLEKSLDFLQNAIDELSLNPTMKV